jgi:ketosteroid isomerase-like protein
MDADAVHATLQRYIGASAAGDEDAAHEIYAEDAVLEFPQSRERFAGVANFREWRRQYPAGVDAEIDRVRGSGSSWIFELRLRYDGGPWTFGLDIADFRVTGSHGRPTSRWSPGRHAWHARWRACRPKV